MPARLPVGRRALTPSAAAATLMGIAHAAEGGPMDEIDQKILEESRRFYAALPPRWLPTPAGQHVVSRDNAVPAAFPARAAAYRSAVHQFGVDGGMVVARVEERAARQLSPAVLLGPL